MFEMQSGVGNVQTDVKRMRNEMGTIRDTLLERFNSLKYRSNGHGPTRPRRKSTLEPHIELHV